MISYAIDSDAIPLAELVIFVHCNTWRAQCDQYQSGKKIWWVSDQSMRVTVYTESGSRRGARLD